MHPDEFKILEDIEAAVKVVYELAYFSGKGQPYNELKYALNKISSLLSDAVLNGVLRKNIKGDELYRRVDELILIIASEKLRRGMSLKDWMKFCKLVYINSAEMQTENLTQACRLMGCSRETVYYARGIRRK